MSGSFSKAGHKWAQSLLIGQILFCPPIRVEYVHALQSIAQCEEVDIVHRCRMTRASVPFVDASLGRSGPSPELMLPVRLQG